MAPLEPFKLEKLKITAYSDRERSSEVGSFDAMFNPTSLSHQYTVAYDVNETTGRSAVPAMYAGNPPQTIGFDLLFDGTGVESIGLSPTPPIPVAERVKSFIDATYTFNGSIHEPNFLEIAWGGMTFSGHGTVAGAFKCRLVSATVNYTHFDRGGNPIRAKLTVSFRGDDTAVNIDKIEKRTSPDVTHTRVVKAGDTLPLLAEEMYGSPDHYLFVAERNGLDDFRNLIPGRQLEFPPLVKP